MPKIQILQEALHETLFLKLLDKMYKYEMDAGWKDRQTDGRSETNIPPQKNFNLWGYKKGGQNF